jgi:photosystem II protein PsbQ
MFFSAFIPSAQALPNSFNVLVGELQTSVPDLEKVESSSYYYAQLNKLSKSANQVESLRSRLEAFQPAIKKREWSTVHKDVAALLPELKQKMMEVTDQLDLSDRILARAISTEVFIHLERIDEADEIYDYQAAETNYLQALQDFDAFLDLIPTS